MRYDTEPIPLSRIDTADETYRITTCSCTDDLVASIERVGVLNPPVLEERPNGYIPVSGFRRIDACRRLERETVSAKVLDKKVPYLQSVMIAVSDNSMQRTLNLIETGRALKMLTGYVTDPRELMRLTADLGLPRNPRHIDKLKQLLNLPPSVQMAVAGDTVSLSMAMALDRIEPDAAVYLCTLFCDLKIGFNKQREIFSLSEEIAAREDISLNSLLHCQAIHAITTHPDLDKTQKLQAIRHYLKQRRYPQMMKIEDRFESNRRNLKLDRHMRLEPPPHFEGRVYTLTLEFANLSELTRQSESLCDLVKNPVMEKILNPSL